MDDHEILLPWYINQTLSTAENEAVESWLQESSKAKEEQHFHQLIVNSLNSQEIIYPAAHIEARLKAEIGKPILRSSRIREWSVVISTAISILILLWAFIRPGNNLTWSITEVKGNHFSTYRIYRAPLGSTNFKLVDEIATEPNQLNYEYSDSYLIPWVSYQYYIEFEDHTGHSYISQSIVSSSGNLPLSRLVIFACYCLLALGFILLVREIFSPTDHKSSTFSFK
jgi:hypothetical protein